MAEYIDKEHLLTEYCSEDERTWDNVAYICGMSVPPIMIKRIVGRIIDTGIFKERKEKNNDTSRTTRRTTTD